MLTVNTILQGRYRIVRQLGQGGMGAVYEAIDERIDKTVAIKEILIELENSSDLKQKEIVKQAFRREANSLVKARHEAVPDVTDYFSDSDREFLVMEYIEGDDLIKMLRKRQGPFVIEEVLPWIDQLLVALDYLHNLQPPIIHRDIKPQNLKLNEWKKIKLLDFGVAKSTDKTATVTQMTFVGATLSYSPIEQILRVIDPMFRELILLQHRERAEKVLRQNTDARCDIFALGATFYHLLTNYPPVDITKRTLEAWEGKGDPLPNPSEINSNLPNSIADWLLKAMAIERGERFSSAVEMRRALHAAITQHDLESKTAQMRLVADKAYLESERKKKKESDQQLMGAKTDVLIELPKPKKTPDKIIEEAITPTTVEPVKPTSDTFSFDESGTTDFKFTETDISFVKTDENLAGHLYLNDKFVDKPEVSKKNVGFLPATAEHYIAPESKKPNYMLILPLVGILGFVIFGGGIFSIVMLMSYSGTTNENKSTFENTNVNLMKTAEISPSVETNSEITSESSNQKTAEPDPIESVEPQESSTPTTGRQTVQPTSTPLVRQTPRPVPTRTEKTPDLVVKTPRPTPKEKKLSNDCIYNNNCD